MKKNKNFFWGLLCLHVFLQQSQIVSSSAASWVTPTLTTAASAGDDRQAVINAINENIGVPAAEAISLIANGAVSPQPYLNYGWFNFFAQALSNGAMPYSGMNTFVLADLFQKAKSSTDYSYIINHLVPALQEMGNNLTNSAQSLVGTLDNVVITTINNNTQMNFDIYQGANVVNVGASNISLQPTILGGGSNSYSPGFKIGSLKPGVNNVALYGAAQGQGDILFVPNDGSGTAPTNGTASGSFRVHFLPPAQSSSSAYVCVQILPIDFPATQDQQTQSMIQRTQCINVSQAKAAINLTLQIEDNMTVWAPSVPATATSAAIQGTPPTQIDQSMIPMYYPSIRNMTLVPQNVPFLCLPESIKSQPILSSWINFINIIVSALQSTQPLMTPDNIANTLANQPVIFLLKQEGNEFGDISSNAPLVPYFSGRNIYNYRLPAANPLQPSLVPSLPGGPTIFCAYAGLVGTQYLFTGDIPSLDDFNLFLQMNSSVNNQQNAASVSLAQSATLSNIWSDLSQKAMPLWNNIAKQGNFTVEFVDLSDKGALYKFSREATILQSPAFRLLPNNGLLLYALSTSPISMQSSSFNQRDGMPVSFLMKDVIAHLQALLAGTTNKQYMPIVGGVWGYVQSQYNLMVNTIGTGNLFYDFGSSNNELVKNLQAKPQLLQLLLKEPQVSLLDKSGKSITFNSFDVLQLLFSRQRFVLFPTGQFVPDLHVGKGLTTFLNFAGNLTQLSLSPTFSDGSSSVDLSLQPKQLMYLNKALKSCRYATITFSVVPGPRIKGAPTCNAVVTVKCLGSSGSVDVNVFTYMFKNLINAKDGKTPIAKTATLSDLSITFESDAFMNGSHTSSVSVPTFTLKRDIKGISPVVPKTAKA